VFTIPSSVRALLAATGHFLTIFPASVLSVSAHPLKVLPVELAFHPVPVGVVTLKDRPLSPVARLFIDCAREIAKPLMKSKRE
jgi:DNA-binding transcriptional LysR family regulator